MLKYGFDLNNEFDNDFAPATEENDCSYTVTSNIYQSMAQPGNTAVMGGVAQSWAISNNSSTITFHIRPGLEFSNGQPVTSADVAASLNHTKTSGVVEPEPITSAGTTVRCHLHTSGPDLAGTRSCRSSSPRSRRRSERPPSQWPAI